MYYMCRKVKIGAGHPGHVLTGSNRSIPILHWITCINNGVRSWLKSNELSMLNSDDRSVSPEIFNSDCTIRVFQTLGA